MGCKAEGAAQGFTLLGVIVLVLYAVNIIRGFVSGGPADFDDIVNVVLAIFLIIISVLSLDACGFIHWRVPRSGVLLAVFGLLAIFIVARGLTLDVLSWLQSVPMLAGFMILLAGILIMLKS